MTNEICRFKPVMNVVVHHIHLIYSVSPCRLVLAIFLIGSTNIHERSFWIIPEHFKGNVYHCSENGSLVQCMSLCPPTVVIGVSVTSITFLKFSIYSLIKLLANIREISQITKYKTFFILHSCIFTVAPPPILLISSAAVMSCIRVKANHFLPRSFSEAPR